MGFCVRSSVLVILVSNIIVAYGAPQLEIFGDIFKGKSDRSGESSEADESLNKFICPGLGKYAIRSSTKKNCTRYYECLQKDVKAVSIRSCPSGKRFHRLSRTCEKSEYVNCKWCIKEGFHADKTSNNHFLKCVPGTVAFRYKCRKGAYDPAKNKCKKTAHNSTMDITMDAIPEIPSDIVDFQKQWDEIANEEKDPASKAIERVDSDEKEEKKAKKKDDDDEKEEKKSKKKNDSDEKDAKKKDKKEKEDD